ncbi:MAG: carboxypeptidase regulatory-like domain-containing protein, partial [Singulisphaera sp.]
TNGKPIEGVKVIVWHKLSRDPKTGGWTTLGSTEHLTDAKGRYQFTLPPKEVAEDSLYIEVEAHHPNYASMGRGGYSHSMIRKNLTKGEPPFYSRIVLWPGEPITGTVVNPAGEPMADVEISMYAASDKSKKFPRGSFDKTKTDDQGKFRIVPPTPGDGVLWILPEHYAPQAHRLADRRGDWGKLILDQGTTVKGHVLDAKGAPVPGVRVAARSNSDGEKADEFLRSNSVAQGIVRNAVTGPNGEYTLVSLPNGSYDVRVEPNRGDHDYDPPPLRHVFLQEKLSIADGAAPDPYDIRAVPHIVINGTYLDSQDEPRAGHDISLFSRMDKQFYFAHSTTPGKDGKFVAFAPHGMELQFDLHTNEHSALRWRLKHDQPLQRGRTVKLGVVEDDITGFEVVRYTAPILLVKPVDEEGNVVAKTEAVLHYTRSADDKEQMTVYTTGSHVSFEKQPDGRSRSSQLLPDEPFSITVKKQGYTATTQELSLAEGQDQEVTIVLKPDPNAEKEDNKDGAAGDAVFSIEQ